MVEQINYNKLIEIINIQYKPAKYDYGSLDYNMNAYNNIDYSLGFFNNLKNLSSKYYNDYNNIKDTEINKLNQERIPIYDKTEDYKKRNNI